MSVGGVLGDDFPGGLVTLSATISLRMADICNVRTAMRPQRVKLASSCQIELTQGECAARWGKEKKENEAIIMVE